MREQFTLQAHDVAFKVHAPGNELARVGAPCVNVSACRVQGGMSSNKALSKCFEL